MAYGLNDRVREQVSAFAGGTGAVTLPVSAVSGCQTFLSGWGASGTGEYALVIGAQWETGFGTLNAGGTTLTRTTTYNGSSGLGVAVNFNAGTMDCFGDIPAELLQYLNMREITVASATTCDIGTVAGSNIIVSGTVTITGFGTKANRRRFVRFSGALTLTHNATSLILPGAVNILTVAGDVGVFQSDASGNWRCVSYTRTAGLAQIQAAATIASASTTDLGSDPAQTITVSGTVTITSFGSSAPTGAVKHIEFSGALTVTQNATSLILPGAANIITVAGDSMVVRHEGSGNWRCLGFMRGARGTLGTATNNNAPSGDVGEVVSASVAQGSPISLSTGVPANITSISLTAGDWDVFGAVYFNPAGTTTITTLLGCISSVSATLDQNEGNYGQVSYNALVAAGVTQVPTVRRRISLASTTTIYLVTYASFGTSTCSSFGKIEARRAR